jgi:hypothetical protein
MRCRFISNRGGDDGRNRAREPVLVDLALQGRRLPGPVNLGVPDRLMQEPWLRPESISGTWGRGPSYGERAPLPRRQQCGAALAWSAL